MDSNQRLTIEQAISILDQATANLNVSRNAHAQILSAIQTIQNEFNVLRKYQTQQGEGQN